MTVDGSNIELINNKFNMLGKSLKNTKLRNQLGFYDYLKKDDFMLMNITEDGSTHFKNIVTRNYLILKPDGNIFIPIGGFFAGGTFDSLGKDARSF